MLRLLQLAGLMSVITLSGLSSATAQELKVVASFSIIADLARNVGGDRIRLTTLVGPNGDAHVYEPEPADAAAMAEADVILVNGLGFEGFVQRLAEASGTKVSAVELSKGGELLDAANEEDHAAHGAEGEADHDHAAEGDGHAHGVNDPHAWQSVHNAETYVKNIEAAFCAADAAGCNAYKANAAAYLGKLDALHEEIKAAVASIPEEKRVIITSHDAFGYFEHEYGLKFLAPEGVSTASEASAADVAALIRQVREDEASAIFVENITNRRLIEQIAAETGITVGGTLYSDALSDESGPAATYIDMMRHNVSTIEAAIAGS
jgi:zinc/manganese transport system substrate-binding protein